MRGPGGGGGWAVGGWTGRLCCVRLRDCFSMFTVWICAGGLYLRRWTFLGDFTHSRGVRGEVGDPIDSIV
jgi:hypothetical protein